MPEVQDLMALLDALVSPAHDLSLAARAQVAHCSARGMKIWWNLSLLHQTARRQARAADPDALRCPAGWRVLCRVRRRRPGRGGRLAPGASACVGSPVPRPAGRAGQQSLPVHDALSAIYDDGDASPRLAAASPAVLRESVLAKCAASLNAALQVDGGRYSSAYTLVRALRAGGIPAPVAATQGACACSPSTAPRGWRRRW